MAQTAADARAARPEEEFPRVNKLSAYIPLSVAEISLLRDLHGSRRRFDRHRDIIAQGRPYRNIFILCNGFAWRYKILPDGKPQLLNFGLPGDLIGFPAAFYKNAVNATGNLTEVVVATVPFAAFYSYCVIELAWRGWFGAVRCGMAIAPGWLRERRSGVGGLSRSSLRHAVWGGGAASRGVRFWETSDVAN